MKILHIDANQHHSLLVDQCLNMSIKDLQLDHVNTGEQAFKKLKSKKYHLILTEIELPDASGEDYIYELNNICSHCPIVVLTSNSEEKNVARTIKAGAEDYIIKSRDSLEAIPKILQRVLTKFERRGHHTAKPDKIETPHLEEMDPTAKTMLGKLESLQQTLKKMGLGQLTGNEDPKISLDQVYEQMRGLKEMVWKVISGGK